MHVNKISVVSYRMTCKVAAKAVTEISGVSSDARPTQKLLRKPVVTSRPNTAYNGTEVKPTATTLATVAAAAQINRKMTITTSPTNEPIWPSSAEHFDDAGAPLQSEYNICCCSIHLRHRSHVCLSISRITQYLRAGLLKCEQQKHIILWMKDQSIKFCKMAPIFSGYFPVLTPTVGWCEEWQWRLNHTQAMHSTDSHLIHNCIITWPLRPLRRHKNDHNDIP